MHTSREQQPQLKMKNKIESHPSVEMQVNVFPTPDDVILAAAKLFTRLILDAAEKKDRIAVALSGGSTPKKLHALLVNRAQPFFAQIPWKKVYFFWGDERFVPPTDAESNFRMAKETLLDPAGIGEDHFFATPTEYGSPEECALRYQKTIQNFFHFRDRSETPRFDLILLGLGANAHTASLFPDTPLGELDSPFLRDTWVKSFFVPELKAMRISFTPRLINAAEQVVFIAVGKHKRDAFQKVQDSTTPSEKAPAKLIHPFPGKLTWLIDEAMNPVDGVSS